MWTLKKLDLFQKKSGKKISGITGTITITIVIVLFLVAILALSNSAETDYSSTSKKCISCHNDSTYPEDTNEDGVSAPYKRPHNEKVMCESCHRDNPHQIGFIQSDGSYGPKDTAGSCPECHQKGIPVGNNSNFTTAFMIYSPLRHSSNIQNGSFWGNYWSNASLKSACIYCHDKSLHYVKPLGRILEFAPEYVINVSIGANFTCAKCHYKGEPNWSIMNATFQAAGLDTPPEITNGSNWNGRFLNYFNHTIVNYTDEHCKQCHGRLLSENATMSEFLHNVAFADSSECIGCHSSQQRIYEAIDTASFGKHKNINITDGNDTLSNSDCEGCHYNISNMYDQNLDVQTRKCIDCHIEGNFSAPKIQNHKPPKAAKSAGGNISTTAYCSICHNNSINKYLYSVNASVSHYGTTDSLVKTVNQTSRPRFGFMNETDAQQFNKECNNCHNPSNSSYGNATLITTGHIARATCDECHMEGNANDLHNDSLGMPDTFNCRSCHTTYADKYGAPNMTGTKMAAKTGCQGSGCHGNDITDSLDNVAKHNYNRNYPGTPGTTDIVYLNLQESVTVTKGTLVNITSRVNDSNNYVLTASRVAGAEYYIDVDPGLGKGIPMNTQDGYYDAINGNWENVIASIDTNALPDGNYTIYVRGMDIGKQWSSPKNATLVVQSFGYINGTVTNGTDAVSGVYVSTSVVNDVTDLNGNYSLALPEGIYIVNTSKQPEYVDRVITNINVTKLNTTILEIVISEKPKGMITGTVTVTGSG